MKDKIVKVWSFISSNEHLKKFTSFGIGSVFAMLLTYVSMYLLNSELTPKQMGEYSYNFSILSFLFPLASISLYSSYLRFTGTYENLGLEKFVKTGTVISFVAFTLIIYFIFNSLLLAMFSFIILFQERFYYYKASLNIKTYNYMQVAQKLVFLIAIYFIVIKGNAENINLILCSLGLSYGLIWLACTFFNKKASEENNSTKKKIDFDSKKIIFKFCFVVMATDIVNLVLAVSDQILVNYYFDATTLAPYAVSFRMASMVAIMAGIFLSYYPVLYYRDLDLNLIDNIIIFRRLFFSILIVVILALMVFSNFVYAVFGASKYIDSQEYFYWLIGGEFFRLTGAILFTFRVFKLQQIYTISSLIFVAILNLAINIIFMEANGPLVAAYSTFLSYFIYFLLSVAVSYIPEKKYFSMLRGTK